MGTQKSVSDSADATIAILSFGFGATQSDFVEVYQRASRNMEMVLSRIPSQQTSSGLQSLGFQSAKKRQWASSFLGISAPAIQEEAHWLLLDLPVPHQTVKDLAMEDALHSPKPKGSAPKITRFFSMDTPMSGGVSTEGDEEVAQEDPEETGQEVSGYQRARPLDKPTIAHLEEYRKVSRKHARC
jgi:hypothetical protein